MPRRALHRDNGPVSTHEIQSLLHEYGLGLVFAFVALQAFGVPIPGTTVLIAAAVYAATAHGLPIAGVIIAGALGALTGASAAYAVGRWRGEWVLVQVARRLRQPPERVEELRHEFVHHGVILLVVGRFITGLRNVVGLLAGASGMSAPRFFLFTALAASVWALVNALEYYFFGSALAGAATWLQIVLVGLGLVWMVLMFYVLRRRAVQRLAARALKQPSPPSVS